MNPSRLLQYVTFFQIHWVFELTWFLLKVAAWNWFLYWCPTLKFLRFLHWFRRIKFFDLQTKWLWRFLQRYWMENYLISKILDCILVDLNYFHENKFIFCFWVILYSFSRLSNYSQYGKWYFLLSRRKCCFFCEVHFDQSHKTVPNLSFFYSILFFLH